MTQTFQFKSLKSGVPPSPVHNNFMDAWQDMYAYVNGLMKQNQLTFQELETTLWIEVNSGKGKAPIMFYDARDTAIDNGWTYPCVTDSRLKDKGL